MKTITWNNSNNITKSLNLRNNDTTRTELKNYKTRKHTFFSDRNYLNGTRVFLTFDPYNSLCDTETDPTHAKYKEASDD